ncbi:MAG: alpha-N-acetylglucosaminidase, partial [Muribaculaceae bacterium]|nr:alpha-N-acetylglucosaminidase [Muribaculaceae bacterium]
MKKTIISILVILCVAATALANDIEQAQALAGRLSSRLAQKVTFELITASADGGDIFTLESRGNKVVIGGNNANSMAVGLNRYLNRFCKTTVSWYGDIGVDLPTRLPDVPEKETIEARVPQRFFLNYCTFGYTMPFWDWADWERFIDWMALNGINMPLAITGQEAVWYNVWTKMGMTDEEVRGYFTGPVYLPWHRMANIDAWCGPLPKEWLDGQAKLQKKIVERERALNMRPVLPAFAGHVPRKLKEMYPNADIKAMSTWDEFEEPYRTFFLNSEDPLYAKIQKMFLEEQTRMFGTDHIYGIDPFNEMDPPSFEPEYLHNVSKHIYESLTAVDPQAEWLQMGWFLYYQRKDYTPERAKAMLTGVPQGKMTMLDYYCEYKEMWRDLDGFFGQPYIWCYLGNFGGNSNIQGNVKEAGEKLEAALKEGGNNLVGIGSTLEGLEVQQFPYEYIFEKAWNFKKTDDQVVNELADRHSGYVSQPVREAWKMLYDSVLNIRPTTFCGPLPCQYPELDKEHGRCAVRYNPEQLLYAWDKLLEQDAVTTDAMTIDLIWIGRQLLGDLFFMDKKAFDKAYHERDFEKINGLKEEMTLILISMEALNSCHPFCTMHKWIEQARDLGIDPEVKDYYEMNARRLVTTWGGDLNDYSSRNWSGLMLSYYFKRWNTYFDYLIERANSGKEYNHAELQQSIKKIQDKWPEDKKLPWVVDEMNVINKCKEINAQFRIRFN